AHVLADRGPDVLVTEMFGQLSVQRGLEDVLRELTEQATRPGQAHALFLGLRKQPLRKLLLIDDLPSHGIQSSPRPTIRSCQPRPSPHGSGRTPPTDIQTVPPVAPSLFRRGRRQLRTVSVRPPAVFNGQ